MVACRREGGPRVHGKTGPPLVSSFSLASSRSVPSRRNRGSFLARVRACRSISVSRRRRRRTLLSPCPLCLHAPSCPARRSRDRAATWLAVADGGALWDPVGTCVHAVGVPDDRRPGTDRRWRWNVPRRGGYKSLLIGGDRSSPPLRDAV